MIRIAVFGAAGRMGRRVVALLSERRERFRVVAAVEGPDSPALGSDVGRLAGVGEVGVAVRSEMDKAADVIIDFSVPAAAVRAAEAAVSAKAALVSGTTGLSGPQQEAIQRASQSIPVVQAPNMSVGVNVMLSLVAHAAAALGPAFEAEIVDIHHRHKRDAPSGTARALLAALEGARGSLRAQYGRCGGDLVRPAEEVGVHSLRMGEIVGEHEVHLAAGAERLVIRHEALSRDAFAEGAIRAAEWVVDRPPGHYDMADVLGLRKQVP